MDLSENRGRPVILKIGSPSNRDVNSLEPQDLDPSLEESDNIPDRDPLAQEIVVPRVDSLGTTLSQDQARDRVEGVEDREAALEQFGEITGGSWCLLAFRKRSIDWR